MSLRFRRRLTLTRGLHLTLSRSGVSATVGVPGLRITLGQQPAISAGLPGSGISYREALPSQGRRVHVRWLWIVLIAAAAWVLLAR